VTPRSETAIDQPTSHYELNDAFTRLVDDISSTAAFPIPATREKADAVIVFGPVMTFSKIVPSNRFQPEVR
jgi:hypothetical protein